MSTEASDVLAPKSGAEQPEEKAPEGFGCVVANVKHKRLRPTEDGSGGELVTQMIKAFPAGAKVCTSSFFRSDHQNFVVGKNGFGRWIQIYVNQHYLENFRAINEYSPAVRRAMAGNWEKTFEFDDHTEAEAFADVLNRRVASMNVEDVLRSYDPSYKRQVR